MFLCFVSSTRFITNQIRFNIGMRIKKRLVKSFKIMYKVSFSPLPRLLYCLVMPTGWVICWAVMMEAERTDATCTLDCWSGWSNSPYIWLVTAPMMSAYFVSFGSNTSRQILVFGTFSPMCTGSLGQQENYRFLNLFIYLLFVLRTKL